MATTSYGVNSPEAVKLWSRKLFHEALKRTWAYKFMGRDSNAVIQIQEDTSKGAGDRVRTILRMLLTGAGISGDGTLEGNEEALSTFTDDVVVDQLRHAVRSGGKMSEQRIPYSVREEARMGLADWWSDRIDSWFMNQVAGNVAQSDTRYTGMNSATAPTTNHRITAGASTTDGSISVTAQEFNTLNLIDEAVVKAKTLSPQVRPIRINGEDKFVLFLHPHQVRAMRTATDTGTWLDIQKANMQGGTTRNNPIFTGALAEHNGVIIHESTRVPLGCDDSGTVNSNVRRAVFCGAQAACLAFGRGYGPNQMSWVEELFDYRNQLGVSAGLIGGLKKTVFNSADFATITISTWAQEGTPS